MAEEVISQPGGGDYSYGGPSQSKDRTAEGFEPTEDERIVVGSWLKRVQRAEESPKRKAWVNDLAEWRGYVDGTKHGDKSGTKLVRTNMVYATIAAQMPELYAKNPTITVSPTDAVPPAKMAMVKRFGATAERVIRKMMVEEGKLKKRAKANIRSTCTTSYGVLKMLYQKEFRGDPIAVRRIEDTQDNLARVEGLSRSLKKEDDPEKLALQRDELRANLRALSASNEVKIYKGFSIDRMKSEDLLILDESVSEFDDYEDASSLAHLIWMSCRDFKTQFSMDPRGATRFGQPRTDPNQRMDDTPAEEQFICVVEIWDRKSGVVRTTAKGMNRWCREPYAPPRAPQRWYPFFILAFNIIEGRWRPLSDVELLIGLQDEYNTTRTNYADVREKAVPVTFFRKGGNLTEEDILAIVNRENKDVIGIAGNPSVKISDDVMRLEGPTIDPAAYDVTMIRNDMDLVVGRSDASRANLIKPKTATEAEIMQEAMQSRQGERRDTHEDLLSEMGEASLETCLRDLTKAEVQEIAGEDCEWPETPQGAEEVFKLVSVRVRAGSSGRPNQQKEREQWGQLLPIIKETMVGVAELRAAGNFDMANAQIELVRETLRRFDEQLDLDSIIPPMQEGGAEQLTTQLQQQVVQLKEQLALCQEELAKAQEGLAKAQQAEQAKVIEAQTKQKAEEAEQLRRDRELDAKIGADNAERERKARMEEEEFARRDRMEADSAEREERMASRKLDTDSRVRLESEKIKSRQTEEDERAKLEETEGRRAEKEKSDALAEKFNQTLEVLAQAVDALRGATAELAEVSGADRVPVYGADGMPERVRVERKQKH